MAMLKRYFKSLDRTGWEHLILGVLVFILTCLLTGYIFRDFSKLLSVIFAYFGLETAAGLVGKATIGSIYRHKDGKNKDIYLAKKEYLDRRFQAMYGSEVVGEEEKESSDGSEGTDESSDKDE